MVIDKFRIYFKNVLFLKRLNNLVHILVHNLVVRIFKSAWNYLRLIFR